MKLLLIKSLLAASVMAYGASAINFCSSGSVQTNTQIMPATPGSTDFIQSCQIATRVAVTYSNAGAPNTRAAAMTMRLTGSTFAADARMIILGNAEYADSLVNSTACNFIIQNNRFLDNSMLYVRGAFSPDTTISITGNSFDFGYPLTALFPDPPGATETFASAIYMHDMYLLENVALMINNNDIKGNSTNGYVAVNAINFGGDVYFYGARASVEVNDNRVDILCNATASFGTAIGGDKILYIYAADAKFAVDNNNISATGSSSVLKHPSIVTINTGSNTGSGLTSFSNNAITANTAGMASVGSDATYKPVVTFGTLAVTSAINVWVTGNTIDVTGSLASIGFGNDVTCSSGAALYVKDNKVTATGSDPRLHFLGSVDLSGTGALWITDNELARASASATSSPVYFGRSLRITEQSAVAVTGNTFNAVSPALMAELSTTAQASFVRENTASLFLCGNSFGGAVLATIEDVKAATSTALGNAATVDDCPTITTIMATNATSVTGASTSSVADTTTVDGTAGNETTVEAGTETSAATTTEPLPGNKGVATSVAAALGAAVVAAAAMLL